jgi:hypothetical protein
MSKNSLLLSDEDLTNISAQTNIESDVIKSWHKGKITLKLGKINQIILSSRRDCYLNSLYTKDQAESWEVLV